MVISISIITTGFLYNTIKYTTFHYNSCLFKTFYTYLYFFRGIQFKSGYQ
ncbi:hypothetical protein KLVAMA180M_23290 [Klebsiella variicola subsp. variicola]